MISVAPKRHIKNVFMYERQIMKCIENQMEKKKNLSGSEKAIKVLRNLHMLTDSIPK